MLINYCLNLCLYRLNVVFLFRIVLNFILLLTRIIFCPYYCINKLVKQFLKLKFNTMKTTLKNYFGLVLLITSMIFTLKALLMVWHFLAYVL